MNNEEVRGVFHDALGETPPLPRNDTDAIISAGRRVVGRRRAWRTSGAVAGITVLVALTGFALQQGGAAPVADAAGTGASPSISVSASPSSSNGKEGDGIYDPGTADPTGDYSAALRDTLERAMFPGAELGVPAAYAATGQGLLQFRPAGLIGAISTSVVVTQPGGEPVQLTVDVRAPKEHGDDDAYLRELGKCELNNDCKLYSAVGARVLTLGTKGQDGYFTHVAYVLRSDGSVVVVQAARYIAEGRLKGVPAISVDEAAAIGLSLPMAPRFG